MAKPGYVRWEARWLRRSQGSGSTSAQPPHCWDRAPPGCGCRPRLWAVDLPVPDRHVARKGDRRPDQTEVLEVAEVRRGAPASARATLNRGVLVVMATADTAESTVLVPGEGRRGVW